MAEGSLTSLAHLLMRDSATEVSNKGAKGLGKSLETGIENVSFGTTAPLTFTKRS